MCEQEMDNDLDVPVAFALAGLIFAQLATLWHEDSSNDLTEEEAVGKAANLALATIPEELRPKNKEDAVQFAHRGTLAIRFTLAALRYVAEIEAETEVTFKGEPFKGEPEQEADG